MSEIYKQIILRKRIYHKLLKDKQDFQEEFGGKWSFSDVIEQYFKIMEK